MDNQKIYFTKTRLILFLSGLICLILGGFIYLLYRPTTLILFKWLRSLGFDNFDNVRNIMEGKFPLSDYFIYCFPDGLWTISYILIILSIWCKFDVTQLLFCSIIPAIGVLSEIGQKFHYISGVFDYRDLLTYLTPYLLYILIFVKSNLYNKQNL